MKPSLLFALAVMFGAVGPIHAEPAAPAKPAAPEVKPPSGVNPKLVSADPDYGYKKEKPIMVGDSKDKETGGPAAEQAYLNELRDEAGKPVTYHRQGSLGGGPDGHILDAYEVKTSTGRTIILYLDMYHPKNDPKKQPAPVGLFKAR